MNKEINQSINQSLNYSLNQYLSLFSYLFAGDWSKKKAKDTRDAYGRTISQNESTKKQTKD